MKPKAAIIIDNLFLKKWQVDSLEEIKEKVDIQLILNCKNTNNKKKIFKHFLYYILNIISLQNFLTKKIKIDEKSYSIINFNSIYIDEWQLLPRKVIEDLKYRNIKIIIKFGMNLLKINDQLSSFSILSFHHGNPSKYRGRPAGFYEILNNEKTAGVIVQELNNKIDSGNILAFGESKVVNFSYKKTAINLYDNSKFLLSRAIDNLLDKKKININTNGINYRLPSNLIVLKFIYLMFLNLNKKLFYGLFFEKKWKVALTINNLLFRGSETISSNNLNQIPISKKYSFYADPFFSCDQKSIRLEALNRINGLGDLLEISMSNLKEQKKLLSGVHYSYPFSFLFDEKEYILAEVASNSSQYILSNEQLNYKIFLKGLENKRIVDATVFKHKENWYLFFGNQNNSSTILNLFISNNPFTKFKPHPKNPIVISPKTARMGGSIILQNDRLIRLGQNNEGEYGESLSILEITNLSTKEYTEKYLGELKIDKFKGPHTLNINKKTNQIIFDYYTDEFSFFAGYRRVIKLINKKIFSKKTL